MLDLLSKQSFMPICYLLILNDNSLIFLKFRDYLVSLVFLSVCELLVLTPDKLDCLVSVV